MQRANVLAVKVHRHVVSESDDRQSGFGRRRVIHLYRSAVARGPTAFQTLAYVVLGNHGSTRLTERFVAAAMISVIVRVDDKTHGLVGNSLEGLLYLFDQRRILIVHDYDSIFTD